MRHGARNPATRIICTQTGVKRDAKAVLASVNERTAPRHAHLALVCRRQRREAAQSQYQEVGLRANGRRTVGVGDFGMGNWRAECARKNSTIDTIARLGRKSARRSRLS